MGLLFSSEKRPKVLVAMKWKMFTDLFIFLNFIFSQAFLPPTCQIASLLDSGRISIVCLITNLYNSEPEKVKMKKLQIHLLK